MIWQLVKARRKQILIDVSTQKDFFLAEGSACIRNHRRVLANIRRIMAWARARNIRIISTCDVYPSNNGGGINYCLDGTDGQKKIRYTLLGNRISFAADGSTDLPIDVMRRCRQIILHKRCVDPFDEPRIERLLSEVRANEFVLIGASAEGAVEAAALGLLQRGKKVTVVVDAVGTHDRRQAALAFRKIAAKGAKLIETKSIAGKSHLRRVGICHCRACRGQGFDPSMMLRASRLTTKGGKQSVKLEGEN
jgi:nicotinamidase/pyrazinamidase